MTFERWEDLEVSVNADEDGLVSQKTNRSASLQVLGVLLLSGLSQ